MLDGLEGARIWGSSLDHALYGPPPAPDMSTQSIQLLCALCLSALASLASGQGAEDRAAQLSPVKTGVPEVPVELPIQWIGGLPFVEARVNEQGPFLFLLDTGMLGSVRLRHELAQRLDLAGSGNATESPAGTAGAPTDSPLCRTTLQLGDVLFEGVPTRSQLASSRSLPDAADGVLGVHLFSSLVLTLDDQSSSLVLRKAPYSAPRGAQLLPLISQPDQTPQVEVQLGAMRVPLELATGKAHGVLLARELQRGPDLQLGSLTLSGTDLGVSDTSSSSVMGSHALPGRVLTLDQVGRQVWIRDAERDLHITERKNAPDQTTLFNEFEYPIDLSTGRPWLQVRLGDREPDAFLFDTGASVTVLDDDYAKELGLTIIGTRAVGDPSSPEGIQCPEYFIEELSFGDVLFEGIPAISMDLHAVFAGGGPTPKAILGLPTFMDVVLTLDYPAGLLQLTTEPLPEELSSHGCILPFDPDIRGGGLPIFELNVAGRMVPTHLDSGAPFPLALPTSLLPELELEGEVTSMGEARTVSGSFEILRGNLKGEVHLGGIPLASRGVIFMGRLREGNLGGSFFREHLVTLDLARHRAWFRASR